MKKLFPDRQMTIVKKNLKRVNFTPMQTDNMYCQPKLVQSCTFCHLIKFTRNQTEHLTLEGHKKYLAAEWKATCPYKNVCQLKLGK